LDSAESDLQWTDETIYIHGMDETCKNMDGNSFIHLKLCIINVVVPRLYGTSTISSIEKGLIYYHMFFQKKLCYF
jgi:hypothetical protein